MLNPFANFGKDCRGFEDSSTTHQQLLDDLRDDYDGSENMNDKSLLAEDRMPLIVKKAKKRNEKIKMASKKSVSSVDMYNHLPTFYDFISPIRTNW